MIIKNYNNNNNDSNNNSSHNNNNNNNNRRLCKTIKDKIKNWKKLVLSIRITNKIF